MLRIEKCEADASDVIDIQEPELVRLEVRKVTSLSCSLLSLCLRTMRVNVIQNSSFNATFVSVFGHRFRLVAFNE